jgi:hypothetical protein
MAGWQLTTDDTKIKLEYPAIHVSSGAVIALQL